MAKKVTHQRFRLRPGENTGRVVPALKVKPEAPAEIHLVADCDFDAAYVRAFRTEESAVAYCEALNDDPEFTVSFCTYKLEVQDNASQLLIANALAKLTHAEKKALRLLPHHLVPSLRLK